MEIKSKTYHKIADPELWRHIQKLHQDRGGVYRIVSMRENKVVPIPRFLGYDQEGILYIGKADSFLDRVINLKKSISPGYNGTSHICGRRYKSLPNIAIQFPFESLYLELIETPTPLDTEQTLIRTYQQKFGEVPPLNAI